MVKNIKINQIHTNTLSCEPFVRRTANGELLCICQCDGVCEPEEANRVYVFHSLDNGETWSKREKIYPEDGQAVYCTELSVFGDEITAYLTVHSGKFFDWKCVMMKSYDNGYTWENAGAPPYFPNYTFVRSAITIDNGNILIPYQTYPMDEAEFNRLKTAVPGKMMIEVANVAYCESGVLISEDGGKTYTRHTACQMSNEDCWKWLEPTIAQMSDGRIVMLMRKDESGWLWRSESTDGGRTWSEAWRTDIPNPSNKPKLIPLDNNRVALIHTPNCVIGVPTNENDRYPLELWISDDDMNTWKSKTKLSDFPGAYSYTDGFYEDGHIRFTIEHNRHTILYFDVELK